MKKVGILTFHSAMNYGAVLQTYALYHTIASLGHIPVIINRQATTIFSGKWKAILRYLSTVFLFFYFVNNSSRYLGKGHISSSTSISKWSMWSRMLARKGRTDSS